MERRFIMILMIDLDKSVFYLSSQIRLGAITSYEPALMTSKTPLWMFFSFLADFNFWFAFLRLQPSKNQPLATCQCYAEKILSGLVLIHKTRNSNSHIINDLHEASTHHQHSNNTSQHILVFWSAEILLLPCRYIGEDSNEI